LSSLTDDDLTDICEVYLKKAIPKFNLCEQDLSDRNDTTKTFNLVLTDAEIEILALYMVEKWVDNFVLTDSLLRQNFSTREFSLFSSANQIDKLLLLKDKVQADINDLLNSYYFDSAIEP
jgi:hypothetical protein